MPPKPELELRAKAREHLDRAKELLSTDGTANVRYAALELRLCIECLAYRLLEIYKPQTSFEAIKKWQPDKILKELILTVGAVVGDSKIVIETAEGQTIEASENRADIKWIRNNWQALGSFLHTPTIHKLETAEQPNSYQSARKLHTMIEELDRVFASEIFDIVITFGSPFECDCGFSMYRSPDWLASNNLTSCPECGTEYQVYVYDGDIMYKPVTIDWRCTTCGSEVSIPRHAVQDKSEFACPECQTKYRLRQQFRIENI